jgi:PilZ domain
VATLTEEANNAAIGGAERRMAPRYPASAVPSITGVRVSPGGGEAFLVNISTSGVLVRCTTKLPTGTPVTVTFEGSFQGGSIKGRVARCFVADIGRPVGLSYHIGIAFNESILFGIAGEHAEPPPVTPEPAAAEAKPALVNRW